MSSLLTNVGAMHALMALNMRTAMAPALTIVDATAGTRTITLRSAVVELPSAAADAYNKTIGMFCSNPAHVGCCLQNSADYDEDRQVIRVTVSVEESHMDALLSMLQDCVRLPKTDGEHVTETSDGDDLPRLRDRVRVSENDAEDAVDPGEKGNTHGS